MHRIVSWAANAIYSFLTGTSTSFSLDYVLSYDIDDTGSSLSVFDYSYSIFSPLYNNLDWLHRKHGAYSDDPRENKETMCSKILALCTDNLSRFKYTGTRTLRIFCYGHKISNVHFITSTIPDTPFDNFVNRSFIRHLICILPHFVDTIEIFNGELDNISMEDNKTSYGLTVFSDVNIILRGCKCTNIKIPRFSMPIHTFPGATISSLACLFENINQLSGFLIPRLYDGWYMSSVTVSVSDDALPSKYTFEENIRRCFLRGSSVFSSDTRWDNDNYYSDYFSVMENCFNNDFVIRKIGPINIGTTKRRFSDEILNVYSYVFCIDHGNVIIRFYNKDDPRGKSKSSARIFIIGSSVDFDASTDYPSPYGPLGCHTLYLQLNPEAFDIYPSNKLDPSPGSYFENIVINPPGNTIITPSNFNIADNPVVGVGYGSICIIKNLTLKGYYSDYFFSYRGVSLLCFYQYLWYNSASIIFKKLHILPSENLEIDPVFICTEGNTLSFKSRNIWYIAIEDSNIETLSDIYPKTDVYNIKNNYAHTYKQWYTIIDDGDGKKHQEHHIDISVRTVSDIHYNLDQLKFLNIDDKTGGYLAIDIKSMINNSSVFDYVNSHDVDYIIVYDSENSDGIKDQSYMHNLNKLIVSQQICRYSFYPTNKSGSSAIYPSPTTSNWIWNENMYDGYPFLLTGRMFPSLICKLFAGDIKPIGFMYNEQEVSTFYVGDEQVWGWINT